MTSESPLHGPPPQLPIDLCRVIAENFHPSEDRQTLLCLALANKAWSGESQRILFRIVDDDLSYRLGIQRPIAKHILFLEAVYSSPTRLALYVESYNQINLSYPYDDTVSDEVPPVHASFHLWVLTQKSLPILANLKHLHITPTPQSEQTPFPKLTGCLFKLKTFRWGSDITQNTPDFDSFIDFLHTQSNLQHFEVSNAFWRYHDLSWLPAGVCPKLTSVFCRVDLAGQVMATHGKIVALTVGYSPRPRLPSVNLSTLSSLRYLRISNSFTLQPGLDLPRNLVLLEVRSWDFESMESLRHLSSLLVLILGDFDSHFDPESIPKNNEEFRLHVATTSVYQCPSLACIIIWGAEKLMRYWKMAVLGGINRNLDTTPEFRSEEIIVTHQFEKPWWTVYGAEVNRILEI